MSESGTVDGRTKNGRQFLDLVQILTQAQSVAGGPVSVSEAALIASAAALQQKLERLQGALSRGRDVPAADLAMVASELRAALADLGRRRQRAVFAYNTTKPLTAVGVVI